jgi:hypothetical protein
MALAAGPFEDGLVLLLQRIERRIRIRQWGGPRADRVGQRAHAVVREQHPLKRGEVVEEPLRRSGQNLCVRLNAPAACS